MAIEDGESSFVLASRRRPSFTNTTTGALAAGDKVTVVFPTSFAIPAAPTIALTGGFANCTATGATMLSTVTITLAGASCALAATTGATLTIAGSDPVEAVRALSLVAGVNVTGTVPDLRPYYGDALAAIVPLRTGGGTRLIVIMSCG